jgi:TorA maturation chaperone TorD
MMRNSDVRNRAGAVALTAACVAAVCAMAGGPNPAHASGGAGLTAPADVSSGVVAPVPDRTDDAIRRAFRQVLRREPTSSELRRYRSRMLDDGWSERDVADDLRNRDDYRSYSGRNNSDVDRVIRRAYEDILHRAPDQEGLRTYRRNMLNDGWTEQDVREVLRNSPEAARMRDQYADTVIRRAYDDILHRAPDQEGLRTYRRRILNDGWDEQDVRQALRKSAERRTVTTTMNREKAEEIVKRAYRDVLGREVDPDGLRSFTDHILRDKWSESDVVKALRNSDEYRNKRR